MTYVFLEYFLFNPLCFMQKCFEIFLQPSSLETQGLIVSGTSECDMFLIHYCLWSCTCNLCKWCTIWNSSSQSSFFKDTYEWVSYVITNFILYRSLNLKINHGYWKKKNVKRNSWDFNFFLKTVSKFWCVYF